MNQLQPLYTATVRVAGARMVLADGSLAGVRAGASPEQLLAASYAACVHRTLCLLSAKFGIDMLNVVVDAQFISRCNEDDGLPIYSAHVQVAMPGVPDDVADDLMRTVEHMCPYARLARHGIPTDVLQAC